MSNQWAIVAIPAEDDYVWKISSEKIPHLTLLFLGDQNDPALEAPIAEYLEHVATVSLPRFGMSVDRRGELGPQQADVLFFETDRWSSEASSARDYLLMNNQIRDAFNSVTQYTGWTPHLTLGYPQTPAHPDNRDYPGIHYVNFDKIALWTGDFSGPTFDLKSRHSELEMSAIGKSSSMALRNRVLDHLSSVSVEHAAVRVFDEAKVKRGFGGKFAAKVGTVSAPKTDIEWLKAPNLAQLDHRIQMVSSSGVSKAADAVIRKHKLKDRGQIKFKPQAVKDFLSQVALVYNKAALKVGKSPSGNRHLEYHFDPVSSRVSYTIKSTLAHITPELDSFQAIQTVDVDDALQFGVRGMKWGVRRTRGSDGHVHGPVVVGEHKPIHEILKEVNKAGGTHTLTNEDMKKLTERINLENNLREARIRASKVRSANNKAKLALDLGRTANDAVKFGASPVGQLMLHAISPKFAESAVKTAHLGKAVNMAAGGGKKKKKKSGS